MDEKIIIVGQFKKSSKIVTVGVILSVLITLYSIWWNSKTYSYFETGMSWVKHGMIYDYFAPIWFGALPILIISLCVHFILKSNEITVTNKRIYGKAIGGKRVDLPMDKVSAVGSYNLIQGIAVATSSGKISFALVKNANEVQDAISNLLINRQNATTSVTNIKQEIAQSSADELKKYKDLLDSGIISQEEFDAKKKQLLGL